MQFYWSKGREAAIIVLSLGFLEDTYYYQGREAENSPKEFLGEQMCNVLLEASNCTKSLKQKNA